MAEDEKIADVIRGTENRASGIPMVAIKALRAKLRLVLAAPDIQTIINWKSLEFLGTESGGQIAINEDWFMRVEIASTGGEHEMIITHIEAVAGAAA